MSHASDYKGLQAFTLDRTWHEVLNATSRPYHADIPGEPEGHRVPLGHEGHLIVELASDAIMNRSPGRPRNSWALRFTQNDGASIPSIRIPELTSSLKDVTIDIQLPRIDSLSLTDAAELIGSSEHLNAHISGYLGSAFRPIKSVHAPVAVYGFQTTQRYGGIQYFLSSNRFIEACIAHPGTTPPVTETSYYLDGPGLVTGKLLVDREHLLFLRSHEAVVDGSPIVTATVQWEWK